MIISCGICKKEFYAKPSHVAKGWCKYCSKNCFDIWQRANKKLGNKSQRWNSIKRICKVCGKEFFRCPAKIAIGRGIYCSKNCYIKGMVGLNKGRKFSDEARIKMHTMRVGKLNPAYIDGRSKAYKLYKGEFTNLLNEKTRKKYNNTCQICGTNQKISVHHKDFNPQNNQLENFITLCEPCHRNVHNRNKIL